MLRQEELAFIKDISTLQLLSAFLKELKLGLSSRKKKVVFAGSRSTAPGGGPKSSQRLSSHHAGKREANELASYGNSIESDNRRPAPGAGSAHLLEISSVTGELPAIGSRQLGPPEGRATYAAVLDRTVALFQPGGSLKPTAIESELSEPAV